jgi:hypothetical protein
MTPPLERTDRPLAVSRAVLGILIRLNVVLGILILALLVATLVAEGPVMRALGVTSTADNGGLILAMRGIMVIGILAVPVVHLIYQRLLSIVETVDAGDPFIGENATRLETIAWAIVGLELMHVGVVVLANGTWVGTQKVDVGETFSVTRWLTILLLFVLARVFDQGARMRDELSGTV